MIPIVAPRWHSSDPGRSSALRYRTSASASTVLILPFFFPPGTYLSTSAGDNRSDCGGRRLGWSLPW